MNKVFLIGNLTRDPELSEISGGIAVCRFSIAVARQFASSNGERLTDFFNITAWRGQAETCAKFLKKGNKVAICGSIQIRTYDDKDGIKRQATDIVASDVEFLTPRSSQEPTESQSYSERPARTQSRPVLESIDDDQLPF